MEKSKTPLFMFAHKLKDNFFFPFAFKARAEMTDTPAAETETAS